MHFSYKDQQNWDLFTVFHVEIVNGETTTYLEFEYSPDDDEMWVPYRDGWIVIQMENTIEEVVRFVCELDNTTVLDKNKVEVQIEDRIDGTFRSSSGSVNVHSSLSSIVCNGIIYHMKITL